MGSLWDKVDRLAVARRHDEKPLVDEFNARPGWTASLGSDDPAENRRGGDVVFRLTGSDRAYSLECQVAQPGHHNFSWNAKKVDGYTGDFVCLGIHDDDDMFYVVLDAGQFRRLIVETGSTSRRLWSMPTGASAKDVKFWLVDPVWLVMTCVERGLTCIRGKTLAALVDGLIAFVDGRTAENGQKSIVTGPP